MTADLRKMAEEHVRDVTSGRLPPEDVASNIAEDFARVRSDGGQKASERDAEPGVSTGQAQSPSNATPASAPKEPALSPAIPPRAALPTAEQAAQLLGTCEECDGYRHGKRNPLLNGGWCPACCNADGSPRGASGGEAKAPERVTLKWMNGTLYIPQFGMTEGTTPVDYVRADLLASALAVLADTKAALEESRRVLTMRSEDLRLAHEALWGRNARLRETGKT